MYSSSSTGHDSSQIPTEARPYRSHKFPACERCRKRKLRCVVDVAGQPCNSCRNSSSLCTQPQREEEAIASTIIAPIPETSSQNHANHPVKRRRVWQDDEPLGHSESSREAEFVGHPRSLGQSGSLGYSAFGGRIQQHNITSPLETCNHSFSAGSVSRDESREASGSKSAMFVGPVMAEDVQMIQNYMSSRGRLSTENGNRVYDTVSDNPNDPVLCLTVPRRREGLSLNNRPGEKQREILEQILGPLTMDVVGLYFEYIHPSFPVMDEEHFLHLYKTGNKGLSAAMVCDLLVSSLIYWDRSEILSKHPCPNIQYAWNLAVAALQEEFMAPGMSTVHAALLDLNGRPTTSITGNTITSSKTVGLSHILGLNRDPTSWKISDIEKHMRIRCWWGVLIHDRWSSFAHGVPTFISKNQYDVPLPTVASLLTPGNNSPQRIASAKCFISLCMLTEILGDVLPLVYDRRQKPSSDISKLLRRLETDLDNWEDSEPAVTILRTRDEALQVSFGGSSSLKLGLLATKMLICRIAFRNATHSADAGLLEARHYSQALLREAAVAIVTFLCSLKPRHLCEFWSPYSSYHIGSAALIALRCAIETSDPIVAQRCKQSLMKLVHWLRDAKAKHQWDIANVCLATCEGPILKLCSADTSNDPDVSRSLQGQPISSIDDSNNNSAFGIDPGVFDQNGHNWGLHTGPSVLDTQNNVNGFEYPWADLWDLF